MTADSHHLKHLKHLRDCLEVPLDSFKSDFLVMICGSICKDWSSMGKGEGFCGQWVLLAAIMISLVKRLSPAVFYHECTIRFPWKIFDSMLSETHKTYHSSLTPRMFGAPVQRSRSYECVVTGLV